MKPSELTPDSEPRNPVARWKRWGVRVFFIAFVIVLVIDTAPATLVGIAPAKVYLWPLLNRVGLWQGQWTLFAPNPRINNAWLSAEVYRPDSSQPEYWNSIYFAGTSTWERFSGFRHINYNNRIQTQGPEALADLSDYLARQLISPTARPVVALEAKIGEHSSEPVSQLPNWRIVLSRNELNVSLPDDGTLPTRDETLWISSSQNLSIREYQP